MAKINYPKEAAVARRAAAQRIGSGIGSAKTKGKVAQANRVDAKTARQLLRKTPSPSTEAVKGKHMFQVAVRG